MLATGAIGKAASKSAASPKTTKLKPFKVGDSITAARLNEIIESLNQINATLADAVTCG